MQDRASQDISKLNYYRLNKEHLTWETEKAINQARSFYYRRIADLSAEGNVS